MTKTITYLKIQRRVECGACKGSGEAIDPNIKSGSTDDYLVVYECDKCDGKGYNMKHKTISLDQFNKLKN